MSLTTSAHWMYNPGGGFYGYEIDNSLRFDAAGNHYLNRTLNGNRKTFTVSFWYKRSGTAEQQIFTSGSSAAGFVIASDQLEVFNYSGAYQIRVRPQRKLRDVSSWYHIVVRIDTTQATASDRVRIYINGELQTSFTHNTYPSQNYDTIYNNNTAHRIGQNISGGQDVDGYLANFEFTDGVSNAPTEFGETKSGIWIPKEYSGSYGTSGFHLEFAGNASDTSGNGNNWTANNISSYDYVLDTPTNNFATHNPLASLGGMTFFEGNTKVRHADIAAYNHARSTMGMTSGKWYWEWYNSASSGDAPNLLSGIVNDNVPISTSNGYVGQNTNSYGWNVTNGARYYNGSNIGTISIPTGDSSGVYMVAYDADNGNLYFGANGTWANSGNPATGTGAFWTGIDTDTTWYPAGYTVNNDAGRWRDVVVNHGQDSTFAGNKTAGGNSDGNGIGDFYYSPPSGFVALCTANLPTGAIDTLDDETPEDYFNTVLWTGNNTNNRAITGVGFQPDLVAAKSRSANSGFNWVDAVRGGTKNLKSNDTSAEQTVNTVISFQSDGFTVGDGNGYDINKSGEPIVGWSWLAGNGTSSNTNGSITSTVSVGATSQQNWFSIVSYTGTGANATVGHGLGVAPELIFVRNRNAGDFKVYSEYVGNTYQGFLNDPSAFVNSGASLWQNTSPTSSVFSIGTNAGVNQNGVNLIAYCFANAEGLCKMGIYTGNSSSDGAFVYTGFRPAFILIKKYTASDDWAIHDNKRVERGVDSNAIDDYLRPNLSNPEGDDGESVDFLSNGFKWRINSGLRNQSGQSYIYLAIAEQPFKYANAR